MFTGQMNGPGPLLLGLGKTVSETSRFRFSTQRKVSARRSAFGAYAHDAIY